MRLLLDTHIAVWALTGSQKLSDAAAALIENSANEVVVSIVSLWEIAIKNNLPRPAREPFGVTLDEAESGFAELGLVRLAIEPRHLREVERLESRHGDPFDCLMVATAIADTYRLVTHDRQLAAYGDHVMLV